MNTGIPSITQGTVGVNSPRTKAPTKQPNGNDSASATVPNAASVPANSNSSSAGVSQSNNGKDTSAQQKAREKATLQEVTKLAEKLKENIQNVHRDLVFSVDKKLGKIVVKVVDSQTHEVIRQIPSEEMLALAHNMDKMDSLLFGKIKA